jgi:hypothetical protein
MEAKDLNIFDDDKKQLGDQSAAGLLPGPTDGMDKKSMFMTAVPTDEEIRELMKGKSPAEKKILLKEIEKARQAKIHLSYLLEQQKLKSDEKWAVRNVEERQAILSLYDNG